MQSTPLTSSCYSNLLIHGLLSETKQQYKIIIVQIVKVAYANIRSIECESDGLQVCTNILRAGTMVARIDVATRVYPGVWGAAIILGTIGATGGKFLADAILSLAGISTGDHSHMHAMLRTMELRVPSHMSALIASDHDSK